jgi:DNA repair protein SbcD/Mre11
MRVLHTSDWHLGTTLGRVRREADHEAVLDEIAAVAAQGGLDLVIHTGDVFDHARPAVDDMHRAFEALARLAAHAPVVVIAGNHDSSDLFEVLDRVVGLSARLSGDGAAHPIRFVGHARPASQGGLLTLPGGSSGGEELRLAVLPFVHPNALVRSFDLAAERWNGSYTDGVGLVEANLADGLTRGFDPTRHVALFAAHLHVGGATWSGSERKVHVADDYATKVDHLPTASYAAFGHIHRPQELPGSVGRYAGSPIPIDFGEIGEAKSVIVLDAPPGRRARPEVVPLSGGRALVRLAGTLEEIAARADPASTGIHQVIVDVDTPQPDLADQIARLLPNATLHSVTERVAGAAALVAEEVDPGAEPPVADQFREFLAAKGTSGPRVDRAMRVFEAFMGAGLDGDDPPFPDEDDFELPVDVPDLADEPVGAGGGAD